MALTETLKKVPVPVWLGLGGAAIGIGWSYAKNKGQEEATPLPATGTEPIDAYTSDYSQYGYDSTGSVPPIYAAPSGDSGETVGAVGQTALETLGDAFGSLSDFVTANAPPPLDLPALITALREPYTGIPQGAAPTPVAVNPAPKPATVASPTKPPGYHSGGRVHNTSGTVSRTFSGASGWIEIPTPDNRFSDFHVAFPNHVLQRWRGWGRGSHVPVSKRGDWDKIWEGRWGH